MRPLTLVLTLLLVLAIAGLGWWTVTAGPPTPEAPPPDRLAVEEVVSGLVEPTDVTSWPGRDDRVVVLGKRGQAWWFAPDGSAQGPWFSVEVEHASEMGLLGVAFDPDFPADDRIWLSLNVREGDQLWSRLVQARAVDVTDPAAGVELGPVVFELEQPYGNHNGGQIRFGPDGMLVLGLGDGGSGGDPHGNGQNPATLLGTLVRLDVRGPLGDDGRARPPDDNPFVGREGFHPAVWAWGLRNPWRFDVLPDGRLVVADVGQNAWEEIHLVSAGDNLGWNIMEGAACFQPPSGCPREGLVMPIHTYPHAQGRSITGGVMYEGQAIPSLQGRFVFGDFVFGHIRSLALPEDGRSSVASRHEVDAQANLSAFGRDPRGEILALDYSRGRVLRVVPASGG